ncbi:MAG TPA: sigma-54 dependent transcriptional regulator [Terriglobales bacterium]|nr:sigma-54 dependent transcriptional regulator [Terriglobales bacterium]
MVLVLEPPHKISLLVIDDEPRVTELMPEIFSDMPIDIVVAADAKTGIRMLVQHHPRVVILDLHLRDTSGMKVLEQIAEFDSRIEVILLSGDYSSSLAIEAIEKGAADFLSKPIPVAELRARVRRSLEAADKNRRTSELDAEIAASFRFEGMIGRSPRMLELFNKVSRVAPHFRTALISGAPGTGKKTIARALHKLSPAHDGPFLVVNCGALRESSGERELLGSENWPLPGLLKDASGLLERAHQGTLVFDQICEMPLSLQSTLLRVLQTGELQRLGSATPRRVDVRMIATTDKDLCTAVADGRLREDLCYRLSSLHLKLPTLEERAEDLPLLQRHFIEEYADQYGKPISGLTRRAQDLLTQHRWPGNVRELEEVVAAAVRRSEGEVLDVGHFPVALKTDPGAAATLMSLRDAQRHYVLEVLQAVHGNVGRAAEILKIGLTDLYDILVDTDPSEAS